MSNFAMTSKKGLDKTAMILLFVFLVVGGIISGLVLYGFPVSIFTCQYVETVQVDCLIQERMVGLIPVQETSISQLKEAQMTSERHTTRQDGRQVSETVYQVTLTSNSDVVTLDSFDQFEGVFAQRTVDEVNDFLLTYTDEPLRIWQASWVPLSVGSFFFLVSVIMVYAVADTVLCDLVSKLRKA